MDATSHQYSYLKEHRPETKQKKNSWYSIQSGNVITYTGKSK